VAAGRASTLPSGNAGIFCRYFFQESEMGTITDAFKGLGNGGLVNSSSGAADDAADVGSDISKQMRAGSTAMNKETVLMSLQEGLNSLNKKGADMIKSAV
jgi:hypothetical protein